VKHLFLVVAEADDEGEGVSFSLDDDTIDQVLGGCIYNDKTGQYEKVPAHLDATDDRIRKRIISALGI
jgi:hypothetical protein